MEYSNENVKYIKFARYLQPGFFRIHSETTVTKLLLKWPFGSVWVSKIFKEFVLIDRQ